MLDRVQEVEEEPWVLEGSPRGFDGPFGKMDILGRSLLLD